MQNNELDMNNIRGCVSLLQANVNAMCNAKTTEEIIDAFVNSKDLLIAIYRFNIGRLE